MTLTIDDPQVFLKKPKNAFDRIAFYGPMGVGKSWCAEELKWHGYRHYMLAGKLKSLAYDLFQVEGKNDRSRNILQVLGMAMRNIDKDVWIKYLLNQIRLSAEKSLVVVDDLRFVNEANYFRKNGFILVLVTCDEDVRQERLRQLYPDMDASRQGHSSETEWKEIEPDFVINSTDAGAAIDIEAMLSNVTYRPRWQK